MDSNEDQPNYRVGDNAATNDGRVTAWGLADVAFELRTANLIAFYNQPHDTASQELHEMIVQRLGLRGYKYSMKNEWTRDDLPHQHEVWDDFVAGKHSDVFHAVDADDLGEVLDEIVDHLNAHHPKSQQHDCGETIDALNRNRDALVKNRDKSISSLQRLLANTEYHEARWRRAHEIVESERDQARERLRETEAKLAKVMSDYQDIEDERDEAAEARTASAVTRDDIDRALINVTSNAMNYPTPSQMLGKDSGPLRRKCVDAVCDLFGIED